MKRNEAKERESIELERLGEKWAENLQKEGFDLWLNKSYGYGKNSFYDFGITLYINASTAKEVHKKLMKLKRALVQVQELKKSSMSDGDIYISTTKEVSGKSYYHYARLQFTAYIVLPEDKKIEILQATVCKTATRTEEEKAYNRTIVSYSCKR